MCKLLGTQSCLIRLDSSSICLFESIISSLALRVREEEATGRQRQGVRLLPHPEGPLSSPPCMPPGPQPSLSMPPTHPPGGWTHLGKGMRTRALMGNILEPGALA